MTEKKKRPEELCSSMTYAGSKRLSIQHNNTFSILTIKAFNGDFSGEIAVQMKTSKLTEQLILFCIYTCIKQVHIPFKVC